MSQTAREPAESGDPGLDWWRPSYLGAPSAMESLTTIASPLLAGFCIALIGVLAQAPEKFRLLGLALLALTVAAVMFIMAVQCGFWARQYLWTPDDAQAWHPGNNPANPAAPGSAELIRAQRRAALGYEGWGRRARNFYSFGLFALLLGLAAVLVPQGQGGGSEHAPWRWVAAATALSMLLFEVFWVYGWRWSRRVPWLRKIASLWFQPAVEKDPR